MGRTRWLVTGATGQLGSNVVNELLHPPTAEKRQKEEKDEQQADNSAELILLTTSRTPLPEPSDFTTSRVGQTVRLVWVPLDLTQPPGSWQPFLERTLLDYQVDYVIHCAAVSAVQQAYSDPSLATAINTAATIAIGASIENLATRAPHRAPRCMVYCSTDMVFGGGEQGTDATHMYTPNDTPAPLSHYGRSKLAGEAVIDVCKRAVVCRLPLMYGIPRALPATAAGTQHLYSLRDVKTTFVSQLRSMITLQPCTGFVDEFRTPASFHSVARTLLAIALQLGALTEQHSVLSMRILHVAGPLRMSRHDMLLCMRSALSSFFSGESTSVSRQRHLIAQIVAHGSLDTDDDDVERVRRGIAQVPIVEVSRNSFPAPEPRAMNLSMVCSVGGSDSWAACGACCSDTMAETMGKILQHLATAC